MEEKVIEFLSSPFVSPLLILGVAFFFSFIENLFPPSPSDVVLLFLGSLISFGRVDFIPLLLVSTLGSSFGFLSMFLIGKLLGERVLDEGRLKFINIESLNKVRHWFGKYGYWIVVANRFLSGTRAVISFFAGISELSTLKSTLLASVSALLWNFLIVYLGFTLGKNWKVAIDFLELYWRVVLIIIVALVVIYLVYLRLKKKSR
jgi:membrane protein DedA with SNARE-associated domain